MALKFSNVDVAKKFEPTVEVDVNLHSAAYSGLLSDAPLKVVEALAATQSPLVQLVKVAAKVDEVKK